MSSPKVSIIVPVFNVERYLRGCIDSLLSQTLSDIEIICGDGGSTDGSLDILEEYCSKDPRIKYISKKGSGYGQSMNDCISITHGEYIGILESDDKVMPEMYDRLYSIASEKKLDWIKGDIYYYYSEKSPETQLVRESITNGEDVYNMVLNPQEDYRPYRSNLRTWSGIYKRSFLIDNDIWHNETLGGSYQDVGFYLKTLYYANRVYFLNEAFYLWRQDNPNSSIHYDEKKLADKSFKEWEINRHYLDTHNFEKHVYAGYNYRKFQSYRWTIEMTAGQTNRYASQKAWKELKDALDDGEIDCTFFSPTDWGQFQYFIKTGKMTSFRYRLKRFCKNNPKIKDKIRRVCGKK